MSFISYNWIATSQAIEEQGNGNPLQYSCLENPMDGGAWWAAVHGIAKSRIRLSVFTFTFHFHALEKEMATHSSVLAWRIPRTGKPRGLRSMGSHRVGHDWSDLAAALHIIVALFTMYWLSGCFKYVVSFLISWLQSPSVDFGAPKNKVWHCFHCFPIYFPWSDGTGCHDLCFLNVEL